MDYQKVYNQIIDRAKNRTKPEGYTETHHIIPRCMGGSDDSENLAVLTAREHFICHWLLSRIYPKDRRIFLAFWMMCNVKDKNQIRYTPSSRIIAEAKEKYSTLEISEETRKKMSISSKGRVSSMKGKTHSEEAKKKMSDKAKGRKVPERSLEYRQKLSESHKGKKFSDQHKKKISEAKTGHTPWNKGVIGVYSVNKGAIVSEETKEKIRKTLTGRKHIHNTVICPYCNKSGGDNVMKRWHFDNCKHKPI